jgi:hypothetical protein
VVHGAREDPLTLLLLLAVTMAAMSAASALSTLATVTLVSTLASGTGSGRTAATAASPAFTASGTSGGVIRSNVHVTLFFRFYPLKGELQSGTRFRSTVWISVVAQFPQYGKAGSGWIFLIYSRPSSA